MLQGFIIWVCKAFLSFPSQSLWSYCIICRLHNASKKSRSDSLAPEPPGLTFFSTGPPILLFPFSFFIILQNAQNIKTLKHMNCLLSNRPFFHAVTVASVSEKLQQCQHFQKCVFNNLCEHKELFLLFTRFKEKTLLSRDRSHTSSNKIQSPGTHSEVLWASYAFF